MRPFLDKVMSDAWQVAVAFSSAVREGAAQRGVAVMINTFNRISILSGHPVRPRDAAGNLVR